MLSIPHAPQMAAAAGPDDDWSAFVMAVFDVNGLIIRAGEGIARPLGQSSARWQVLGRAFEPRTVAQMAADIGHSRQGVQRIADVLEREGLVEYRAHPADRRTKLVQLTAEGRAVLEAIYHRQLEWSARVTASLDTDALTRATNGLRAVEQALHHVEDQAADEPLPGETSP
jgi:DNA-binding MarR family transcriptional regulator